MEVNTNFYFDTQIAIGFAWDKLPGGVWLTFYVLFFVFVVNIVKVNKKISDCEIARQKFEEQKERVEKRLKEQKV